MVSKTKIRFLGLFILVAAFITIPATASPHYQKHKVHASATPEEILHYVNIFRESHGLKALKMNGDISSEAEKHSRNMARHIVPFGHAGFDNRANRLGKKLSPVYATAENVAMGNMSAKKAVNLWIHSPGHRKNMLGKYNLTGIGIARGRNGYLYFTQIFINKK